MSGVTLKNNVSALKYWSWIGAFALSFLFWCQLFWLTLN
ncbi:MULTISPECIES: small membrane protein YmiC [Enterobacteriaceae]|nr:MULTISPECIES: small membrane protein YmiC [Enterobacteriaceae]